MKLSEAILLGIGAVDNNRMIWWSTNVSGVPSGCALGTALYSVGRITNTKEQPTVYSTHIFSMCQLEWPWISKEKLNCIIQRHFKGESREEIAQWIASIEPQDQPITQGVEDEALRSHLVG